MKKGALVISLDFELLWGVFDKVDWREKQEYFRNTRKVIPEILELFEKYEISCTWATVGMLFNENWDDWNQNIPEVIAEYENKKLSAYDYGKSIQHKETEEFCFAPDLIRQIRKMPGQEIATHTYSHYYCLEPGQTPESLRADLEKSRELAKKFGIDLKSLVFPRNQFNSKYLGILTDVGLTTVRTNPNVWYWKKTQKAGLHHLIGRTGDAYFGLNNKSYSNISEIFPGVTGQSASRFMRPYSPNTFLNHLKIRRIIKEMSSAAKAGEVFHLWWHPHNFGENMDYNLKDLKKILDHFQELRREYGFQSKTMKSITSI